MNARALKFISKTIEFETGSQKDGGWNDDPSDPGGPTQWGISSNHNPDYAELIRSKQLSKATASEIYYRKYYRKIRWIDSLPEPVAFMLFDARVHGSMKPLVAEIQRCLNMIADSRLKVDGLYGPATYRGLVKLDNNELSDLMTLISTTSPYLAKRVARATMNTQKRQGRPVRNYTNGFANRFSKRVRYAYSLV